MTENMPLPAVPWKLDNLLAVYARASHYALCRERAQALHKRTEETPGSLAEAIERDFIAFELEDAARSLCEAVRAAGQPQSTEPLTTREAQGCAAPVS